jgi:glucokinase
MTMSEKVWVGVDIGGTKTAVVLSAAPPIILARTEFPTLPAEGPARPLQLIKDGVRELLARSEITQADVQGIGASCGSPLDRIAGVIQAPPNLPTWIDVPIVSILQEEFSVPCKLENDANAGAVAEYRFGAGRGCQNMVFLTMGTGFGAGVIIEGQLYHGATDCAGEIGHIRLTRTGPVGYNKAGSAEGWASGGGMAQVAQRRVEAAQKKGTNTLLAAVLDRNRRITARDVAEAAQQGDALAKQIVRSTARRLGEALAILMDILNPDRIVIGGLAMRFGETLLGPARAIIKREALPASVCPIVPAALDEQIGDIAALCVAMGL